MTNANPTPCTCRSLTCPECGPRMHGATISTLQRVVAACRARGNEAGVQKYEDIIRGEKAAFARRLPG